MNTRDLLRSVKGKTPLKGLLRGFIQSSQDDVSVTGGQIVRGIIAPILEDSQDIGDEERTLIREVIGELRQRAEANTRSASTRFIVEACDRVLQAHPG